MTDLKAAFLIAIGVLVTIFIIILMIKSFMYICRPNEVLILSGRKYHLPDQGVVGFRIVNGGRAFKLPIIERVDRMDMTIMPISVHTKNAYSKGAIPLNLTAIAHVKVDSNPAVMGNAIERFLGRDRSEIMRVARETLEGNLRNVIATLTPEEVNQDRLKFSKHLAEEVDEDLEKLGLQLDTLKIQTVTDDTNYLDNIGREQIANIKKMAEIAESNAKREAAMVQAESQGRAKVAEANAQALIAQKQNELRRYIAEQEARANSEEERATAAAEGARASAEAKLQQVRTKVEEARLKADVTIPAEAKCRVEQMLAQGRAAVITETGKVNADVLSMVSEAWRKAGSDAKDIYLIQRVEELLGMVVQAVKNTNIKAVNLLDDGKGLALASYISAFPAAVNAVLAQVQLATGVDIPAILKGTKSLAGTNKLATSSKKTI
ncbi:MAG: flotillin family protein [Deltaproteobacteria bacterium]|nr:flotillin family protein [Deltaproteobacteria bacterium]